MCDCYLTSAICTPSRINPYLALPGAGPVRWDVSNTEQGSDSQILERRTVAMEIDRRAGQLKA